MGKLFLLVPLSTGKCENVVLCQTKVVYPWFTAWKLAGGSQLIIWEEIKSVCEFWVLTRPVPRRKTCCWLAQGITDHSWLAPHLPTASHGLAHCTAALRSAHWGPGHEGCPQFFRGNVRPVQPPAYPYSYLPTYNGRKIRVNVNVLWFSRFSKILFDPFLRTVVSLR
jgi:hypothetical protein